MLADLLAPQRSLADYMSELSEAGWSAGWLAELEFDLWRAVIEGPQRYGRLDITQEHINKLRSLSQVCGGWIIFGDKTEETFIDFVTWQRLYQSCLR